LIQNARQERNDGKAWDGSCRTAMSQPKLDLTVPGLRVATLWSLAPCADQSPINIWHALHAMRLLHGHELTCHLFSQGYEADNPNIDLLRLRNFTAGCKLKEDEVLTSTLLDRIAELVSAMRPFVSSFSVTPFSSTQLWSTTPRLSPLTPTCPHPHIHNHFPPCIAIFQRLLRELYKPQFAQP
jgi:hypothetical protein